MTDFNCQRHWGCFSCIVTELNNKRKFVVVAPCNLVMRLRIKCFVCRELGDGWELLKHGQFESDRHVQVRVRGYNGINKDMYEMIQEYSGGGDKPALLKVEKLCPFCQLSQFDSTEVYQQHMRICAFGQFTCGVQQLNGERCSERLREFKPNCKFHGQAGCIS